jgi:hypothetical protein
MPSTYSPSLRIELIGEGEQDGIWGQTTNSNLGTLIEQAIVGVTTVDVTAGNVTLTSFNGTVDEARSAVLVVNGTNTVARNVIIPNQPKTYIVVNNTSENVGIKTSSGTAFLCAFDTQTLVYCDGSNVVNGPERVFAKGPAGETSFTGIDLTGNNQTVPTARIAVKTTGTGSLLQFGTSNSYASGITNTAMTIDDVGRVGIGDTTPNYALTVASTGLDHQLWVRNTGTSGSDDAIILVQTSGTGTTATISGLFFGDGDSSSSGQLRYNHNNDSMDFYTNSTKAVEISSAGDVGIGTSTTPAAKLDIRDNSSGTALRITQLGSGNAFLVDDSTNIDATPFVIDALGDVGIGTTAPAYKLDLRDTGSDILAQFVNTATTASNDAYLLIKTSSTGTTATTSGILLGDGASDTVGSIEYSHSDDSMAFSTAAAERGRFTSTGEFLVGKTVSTASTAGVVIDDSGLIRITRAGTGSETQVQFNNNNGTTVGSINTSGSSTVYNTSSDYRLKDNVVPMVGALEKLAALKPCTYTWKTDGAAGQGFIAHELQTVVPEAVTGVKDGEEMQGVDYSKLTPVLTAALQEAIAEIKSLRQRVAALEEVKP